MNIYSSISIPDSVQNLLTVLETAPENTRILAGGTDILLEMKQGIKPAVDLMVDVTEVPEMLKLEERGRQIFIGAAVPLSEIIATPLVKLHTRALYEACKLIGGPQVRNVATLGGNVAHALPAADGSIALLCLDAKAEIVSCSSSRVMELRDLYSAPGKSTLDRREVIHGFWLNKLLPYQSSSFKRIMRPQGVALPILNLAIWLERKQENIRAVRISVGPGGPVPTRGWKTEEYLIGKKPEPDIITQAVEILLGEVKLRTSAMRATAGYRKHLCMQLFTNVFWEAWQRASSD